MTAAVALTEPGVYDGVPLVDYLADPIPGGSLTSSGARLLLPPSCPAKYRHWVLNGGDNSRVFDVGHAAHALALGDGRVLTPLEYDNYRTKAAQAERDAAYADGRVPILAPDWLRVQAMLQALRAHPIASRLLSGPGNREQTAIWQQDGIWCRARFDWLPARPADGHRLVIGEYKTCDSADPAAAARAMASHGYYQQGAWYTDGARILGLSGDTEPAIVLIFQEREPPYLVKTYQPDEYALAWGQRRNAKARGVFRRCQQTGEWPGYGDEVSPLALPKWTERDLETAFERGELDVTEE
jgi:hypothetical protein